VVSFVPVFLFWFGCLPLRSSMSRPARVTDRTAGSWYLQLVHVGRRLPEDRLAAYCLMNNQLSSTSFSALTPRTCSRLIRYHFFLVSPGKCCYVFVNGATLSLEPARSESTGREPSDSFTVSPMEGSRPDCGPKPVGNPMPSAVPAPCVTSRTTSDSKRCRTGRFEEELDRLSFFSR